MASVSLEDIKRLREQLGTGMVDTKNALEEAGGDVEKATEILRLKGAKGNAKRADRSTSEGLVAAHEADGAVPLAARAPIRFSSRFRRDGGTRTRPWVRASVQGRYRGKTLRPAGRDRRPPGKRPNARSG